jgi:phosphoribosylformimino-5-aminoimidazole carboxamide ribotide isomerase
MIFFPAIDLKDGKCVRLLRGDMELATVFANNPAEQAKIFQEAGCAWLHVVDLNGAFEGRPVNGSAIDGILDTTNIKVQLGGGIRDYDTIKFWLDRGVSRVILGTAALKQPHFVKKACEKFPGQVAVGIDAKGGFVAVEGWSEVTRMTALELAKVFEEDDLAAIIYTDIDRDGVMSGPNTAATINLARAISTPVIASGGISSMSDLKALKMAGKGFLAGVISGRAVYDGIIDPKEATAFLCGEFDA